LTGVSGQTFALVSGDGVDTCRSIVTRTRHTLVDVTRTCRSLESLRAFARVAQKVAVCDTAASVFTRRRIARGQCRFARVSCVPKWAGTLVLSDLVGAHSTVQARVRSAFVRLTFAVDTFITG